MSDEAHSSPWRYVASWIALAALTTLTYTLARYDLGNASLAVALLIAGAKATIVVLFFMHLWDQKGANRIVFAVSLLFVVVLGGLTIVEMATRFPLAVP
jgi:cytochrome c oxidase subunit 4